MKLFSYSKIYLYAFFLLCAYLGFIAYLHIYVKVQPCVLNYIERLLILILAIIFLAAVLQNASVLSRKIYSWLGVLISIVGMIATGRHVWLQHAFAAQSLPQVHNLMDIPFLQLLRYALIGTAECCKVQWEYLGLSLSEWTFCVFLLAAVLCFWQQTRKELSV